MATGDAMPGTAVISAEKRQFSFLPDNPSAIHDLQYSGTAAAKLSWEVIKILDKIAYRRNAIVDPSLSQGVAFFSFLRNMTADGFFTSEIGIKYLGYIGSAFLKEFPGCPPVPEA